MKYLKGKLFALFILAACASFAQCVNYNSTTSVGNCTETASRTKNNGGTLTITGTLDFGAFDFTVRGPIIIEGTLNITGLLKIGINGIVTVADGGSIVAGEIQTGGSGALTIADGGTVTATSFINDVQGPATNSVIINGSLTVSPGVFLNNGDGDISGSGTFSAVVTDNGTSTFSGDYDGECTGDCEGVLPILLANFSAIPKGNMVELNWSTATEIDNNFFSVLRSADGSNFEEILRVNGAGDSKELIDYSATDTSPLSGLSYYKLKQTDFDGEFEEFEIISLTNNRLNTSKIQLFPNPTSDYCFLSGDFIPEEIKIYNAEGSDVSELIIVREVSSRINLDLTKLDDGVYFIKSLSQSIRVVKR